MISRRSFLKSLGRLSAIGLGTATYGAVIEPGFMLRTTAYAFTPPRWTPGLKLRVAVFSDLHCVDPWMPLSRFRRIVEALNALNPDLILGLGDYVAGIHFRTGTVNAAAIAAEARALHAPLGVFSINGNHDWWDDRSAQKRGVGPPDAQKAFEDVGIPVLANRAVQIKKDGKSLWLAGTDSMVAFVQSRGHFRGADDLPETLAQVTDDAPIIHLAHEPDLFVRVPDRVSLTLSGHTHGGQVRLFGYSPIVPSSYGNRFAYGHVIENGRHLIISGGLGCSTIPVRIGSPPEINLLELG
jgi:uncharacterized protein